MSHKSSLLSLTAIVVLSALLTAFSPTADHRVAAREHSETPAAASIPENELTVAEAAIEQFIIRGRPLVQTASHVWEYRAGTPILVSEETWGQATTSGIKLPLGQEEAFRDYVDRNRETGTWDRAPSLTVPSEFAPPCLTSLAEYWNLLLRAHPGATGVLTISRPGFSANGQTAWIQIHVNTGPGTAPRLTWWVHLRKNTSGWSLVEAHTLTDLDRYFSHLPKTIPRDGAPLWKLWPEGSYEERLARKRLARP